MPPYLPPASASEWCICSSRRIGSCLASSDATKRRPTGELAWLLPGPSGGSTPRSTADACPRPAREAAWEPVLPPLPLLLPALLLLLLLCAAQAGAVRLGVEAGGRVRPILAFPLCAPGSWHRLCKETGALQPSRCASAGMDAPGAARCTWVDPPAAGHRPAARWRRVVHRPRPSNVTTGRLRRCWQVCVALTW